MAGPDVSCIPANMRHSPNVVSMLAHRLRRWPNIDTTLGECLVLVGMGGGLLVRNDSVPPAKMTT